MKAAIDRGESASMKEPLVLNETVQCRAALADFAFDLAQKSAGFRRARKPNGPGSFVSHLPGAFGRALDTQPVSATR
jgi:hypothetical protein